MIIGFSETHLNDDHEARYDKIDHLQSGFSFQTYFEGDEIIGWNMLQIIGWNMGRNVGWSMLR